MDGDFEMVDEMQKFKGCIILKINFEKVYDWVNCDFLWFVLTKMGFRENWI